MLKHGDNIVGSLKQDKIAGLLGLIGLETHKVLWLKEAAIRWVLRAVGRHF